MQKIGPQYRRNWLLQEAVRALGSIVMVVVDGEIVCKILRQPVLRTPLPLYPKFACFCSLSIGTTTCKHGRTCEGKRILEDVMRQLSWHTSSAEGCACIPFLSGLGRPGRSIHLYFGRRVVQLQAETQQGAVCLALFKAKTWPRAAASLAGRTGGVRTFCEGLHRPR